VLASEGSTISTDTADSWVQGAAHVIGQLLGVLTEQLALRIHVVVEHPISSRIAVDDPAFTTHWPHAAQKFHRSGDECSEAAKRPRGAK